MNSVTFAPTTTPPGLWQKRGMELLAVVARWLLGAIFIYMGLSKALHPELFLKLVRQYELTANPFLLNALAAGLPWFEVFCGVLLFAGIAVRGACLVLVAMLVPFTLVVLHRALLISSAQQLAFCAVKFDCGCGSGEVLICRKLVENLVLIVLACWLMFSRSSRFCARFALLSASIEARPGDQ